MYLILSRQCGLHDTYTVRLPIEFSSIRELRQYKHLWSCVSHTAANFTAVIYYGFTKHCCWHRNYQLSTSIFHGTFEFFIINFNEEDTTLSSGIIELWFLVIIFCCALRFDVPSIYFHISGHTLSGLEVVCFLVSLPRPCKIRQLAFHSTKRIL